MNIGQLQYVIAIASTGSLSGAARTAGVSQPAISKFLSELEQDINLKLFEPDGKMLRPTKAGLLYIQAAQDILGLERRIASSLSSLDRSVEQELRVGILPHPGEKLLAELFLEFNSRFPQTRLRPQEGSCVALFEAVRKRDLNLAIVQQPQELPKDLVYLPLFCEELLLAVPRTYPMVPEEPVYELSLLPYAEPQDFASSAFISLEPGTPLSNAAGLLLKGIALHRQRFFSVGNADALSILIQDGAGVGFLPAGYCKRQSNLAFFRFRQPAYLSSGAVMPQGYSLSDAERYLLFLLLKKQAAAQTGMILWNDLLCGIVRQFGTALDEVTQCMERENEH